MSDCGVPLIGFICQPNSHPFQERSVPVTEQIKIGRSVARARPAPNNAIFDCKVLSRNHALVWYDQGKFFLKDTKSSNGTFVNSQRLSKGTEESQPREIYSGDIIQFGVEVMENSLTHGCIVAQVSLTHADGSEARRKDEDCKALNGGLAYSNYTQEQVFQLEHYLQEALYREQALDKKLETLQKLLQNTQDASEKGWQALLNEDRLLAKLELLENQLQIYVKSYPDDTLRAEVARAQQERYEMERTSKAMLDRILEEKTEALRKMTDLERNLWTSEEECAHLREAFEETQEKFRTLNETYHEKVQEIEQLQEKLKEAEEQHLVSLKEEQSTKSALQAKVDLMEHDAKELMSRLMKYEADRDFDENRYIMLRDREERLLASISPSISGQDSLIDKMSKLNNSDKDVIPNSNLRPSDVSSSLSSIERESLQGLMRITDNKSEERNKDLQNLQGQLSQAELDCTAQIDKMCDIEEQLDVSESKLSRMMDNTMHDVADQLTVSRFQANESSDLSRLLQGEIDWLEQRLLATSQSSDAGSVESGCVDDHYLHPLTISATSDLGESPRSPLSPQTAPGIIEVVGGSRAGPADLSRIRDLLRQVLETQQRTETRLQSYHNQVQDISEQKERSLASAKIPDVLEEGGDGCVAKEKDELEDLKREVDELRALLTQERETALSSQTLAKQLQDQVDEERHRADDLALDICQMQKEIVNARNAEASPEPPTTSSDTEVNADVLSSLSTECDDLRARLARMEEEVQCSQQEHDQLTLKYDQLKAENTQLQQEVDRMTSGDSGAASSAQEITELRCKVSELQKKCDDYETELTVLRLSVQDNTISGKTRLVSACAVIPLMVILLAIMVSLYLNLTQ